MKPGYRAIYTQYRESIIRGLLKPGDKVPSVRVLASELGVARKTVETAWSILVGEGFLVSDGARGTRVNPQLVLPPVKRKASDNSLSTPASVFGDAERKQTGFLRLGIPALDAFPSKKWLLLSAKAVRALHPGEMLAPPLMGYAPLRDAIAHYLNVSRGLACSPDQVVITGGYQHNLRLILTLLACTQQKVVYEEPGYFLGQRILEHMCPQLHSVPVDNDGLDINYLLRNHRDAHFIFVTPSHQSPLAVTLSLPRRQQLLAWASQRNSWIVEDDYDGEFHYTRKVVPALKSLDNDDRVIYMGTFSKTMLPSLRTSYLVLPRVLLAPFKQTAELIESGQPLLTQKILAAFLGEGHFYKHLKKMRNLYSTRRGFVLGALAEIYPLTFDVEVRDGGMHIIAFLRDSTQDVALAQLWQRHELQVSPLSEWYRGSSPRYGLIIGYTNVTSAEEAIALLQRPAQETQALLTDGSRQVAEERNIPCRGKQ
ncbi:PLP-dependent aminotransferase family protein [Kosakonia sp. SMBL-WEM22]|uniref:MocR-like pyridoxine biosynthesis transcription factor PdxR n=1 Tax=Kosakonia sp. SMBL-WEM22 TaxID=2725560 RepID=UPI0016593D9C|nr:PLP-dependent aminotransferase family protein [Kosakonia sp. SMBL-WEM22]QNQ20281.1 PLP-dependent aminotransferase family protein [Kosakonia sp. SMBL-WEM22]